MKLVPLLLAALVATLAFAPARCDDLDDVAAAEGDAQGGPSEGDLEMAQQIFRSVSPGCRDEMQRSMSEQTELSDQCKMEIQAVIRESAMGRAAAGEGAAPRAAPPAEDVPFYASPGMLVLVFVVLFVAGIGAFAFYVHKELEATRSTDPRRAKRLRKKKKEVWSVGG